MVTNPIPVQLTGRSIFSGIAFTVETPATSLWEEYFRSLLIPSVLLRIRRLKQQGGPEPRQGESLSEQLGAEPLENDKPLRSAHQFNLTAEAIARLAFAPEGCRAFGLRFEANPAPSLEQATPLRLTKHEIMMSQAQHDAMQEAERTILSWRGQRPLTGYSEMKTNIRTLLAGRYNRLETTERVEITCNVARLLFETLLPEYEHLYGATEVRRSWAAIIGNN